MLSAACNVCSQRKPGRKTNRKGEARFGRNSPGVEIVLPECAELIDQLPVVVEARFKRGDRLMIEQPRADAVTDLAAAALLVGGACRIDADRVENHIGSATLDQFAYSDFQPSVNPGWSGVKNTHETPCYRLHTQPGSHFNENQMARRR